MINWVITVCTCITAIAGASAIIVRVAKQTIEKAFKPVNEKIDAFDKRECQTYLIDFLSDVQKNGASSKDETQWTHAHAVYDHYTNELHENSYVHDKWERVVYKK